MISLVTRQTLYNVPSHWYKRNYFEAIIPRKGVESILVLQPLQFIDITLNQTEVINQAIGDFKEQNMCFLQLV